jgi:alpha-tubulin suppressor-like RCC1 family protein
MLNWIDNVAVAQDGNTYVMYEISEQGDLWISGDNWRGKKSKDGLKEYPNVISRLGSTNKAKQIAEEIQKLIASEPYKIQRKIPQRTRRF